jgi:transglutaminase-like putative cysteine protease
MRARQHELELLLLPMFAAVPLYATQTISAVPLIVFHLIMAIAVVRVALGKSPEVIPAPVMRGLAVVYVLFYVIDLVAISHNAIAASTHLALFIAVYQPMESAQRDNRGQRLLSAAMLFVASIATATHMTILPFVIVYAYLTFRQLIRFSHVESLASLGITAPEPPLGRAALFYVMATSMMAVALFPFLPRVRNPFVPGMAAALSNASTGMSDSIDFNEQRSIVPDPAVVSRVWMNRDAVPFFTPLRLRAALYDRFENNQWLQGPRRGAMVIPTRNDGSAHIARPVGFTRTAQVQQRLMVRGRLLLPEGTYAIRNIGQAVYEGPMPDTYMLFLIRRQESITYEVGLARGTAPRRERIVYPTNYPVTPPVAALARQIVGNQTDPMLQASAIEHYLSTRFKYIPNPADIGRKMSVDDFLLKERRGHCEYFAAGMVALMTSLNVPARIVGGFYGGQLNPLTGYFVVRREDAHAWTEVWDGKAWQTFDATPSSLRPGNSHSGLLKMYASALGDSVSYFWDRYILTFGLTDQIALITDTLKRLQDSGVSLNVSARRSLAAVRSRDFLSLAVALAAAGALVIVIRRGRRSLFELLAARLRLLGIEVGPSMTMEEALVELRATRPDAAAALAPLIEWYEAEQFSARRERGRAVAVRRGLARLEG